MNNDSTNDYELDISRYKIILKLETGGYGTVYKVEEIATGKYYAAKVINCNGNKAECRKMANNEILILEKVNHPTIIKFIGYSKKDFKGNDNITLLLELQKQSLFKVLENCRLGLAEIRFTNTERQIILVGIARGMKYLHAHNVIHRDLKPGNILLNEDYYPFITDFGMSKICKFGHSQSQSLYGGTVKYDAPEILKAEKYNKKVDVYAFGILMFEVVTQTVAYSNIVNQFELIQKVQNGYRPDFRDIKINENIKNLIIQCWSDDPKERPEFAEIFNKLAYKISDNDDENYFLDDVDADCLDDYVSEIIEADDLVENQHEIIISQKQQIEKLQSEFHSLNDQYSKSKNKIDELKDKIIDNEHVIIDNKNMMIENVQLKNDNIFLRKNKQEIEDENSKQKVKIEQITNECNQLKSDINDLTNEINKQKAYNEQLTVVNTQLANDKDRLANKNPNKKQQLNN